MQSTVNGSSIQYIIELDKRAKERAAEAKKDAEKITAEAEEKKAELLKNYQNDSKKQLEIVEATHRHEAEEKIAEIEAEKEKKLKDFDKKLDENREKLADSIFEAVTGSKRRR